MLNMAKILLVLFTMQATAAVSNFNTPILNEKICNKLESLEVRFYNYYIQYLSMTESQNGSGHNVKNKSSPGPDQRGHVLRSINYAVNACCPSLNVSYVWYPKSKFPIQADIQSYHLYNSMGADFKVKPSNGSKLVFYFPEFTHNNARTVYDPPNRFLRTLKSPGHVILMRQSDAAKGIELWDVVQPSLPLILFLFTCSLALGIFIWLLDHHANPEHFSKYCVCGFFDGFWLAVVTMTTVGYGDKAPKFFLSRVVTVAWMLVSFIVFTLIGANTTSIMSAQKLNKISRTIGLKIGVVNSKYFVESDTNLGAELIDFDHSTEMYEALMNGTVDRIMFPHYIHYLTVVSQQAFARQKLHVAKVLEQPFELGLVLAMPTEEQLQPFHKPFLTCLWNFVNFMPNTYTVKHDDKENVFYGTYGVLRESSYLMYYLFGTLYTIAGIFLFGGIVDLWKYYNWWKKVRK